MSGPMAMVDYLDRYTQFCDKRHVAVIPNLKKTVEAAIDCGERPEIFRLNGNSTELRERRVDDDTLESIFAPMNGLSFLKQLDLSYNEITDAGAIALAKILKEDNSIEVIDLRSNNIKGDGAVALAKALHFNERLAFIDLSENAIGDVGGMAFARCSLGATSLIALATVLQSSTVMLEFDISNNMLYTSTLSQSLVNDVMSHFAEMIQLNNCLRHLNLSKMGITDWLMCDILASAIKLNTSLEVLNLNNNRISRDGGSALCRALVKHVSISTIKLSCCSLQDEGALAVANMLSVNRRIREIHLDHNKVSGTGLIAIAQSLKPNFAVQFVAVWGNFWDVPACQAFAELVGGPQRSLSIGDGPLQYPPAVVKRAKAPRFKPQQLDVSFYALEGVLHVAHAPRASGPLVLEDDE